MPVRRWLDLSDGSPPAVPLGRSGIDRYVPWIIAPMAYLATLALAIAMALSGVAGRWDTGLSGTLTVQIPPGETETETAVRVGMAVAVLEGTAGIAAVAPLDPPEVAALLEPWLDGAPPADLPLPALIDVRRAAGAALDVAALEAALAETVPGTTVDDHAAWLNDLRIVTAAVQAVALGAVGLIGLAAVATVVFVTRAGLAIHHQVVDILHIMGAPDAYIARQYQRQALIRGATGGVAGLVPGLLTLLGIGWAARDLGGTVPEGLSLGAAQWLVLALVPLACAGLAMLTARLTVLRALRRLV
jgi:cell division transport system permease protein